MSASGQVALIESPTRLVSIAVPLPIPDPLTYRVPRAWTSLVQIGVRARVRVGKRRLVGYVVGEPEDAPEGIRLKEIESILDIEALLTAEVIQMARFVSDYYLAPLGEVLRSAVPGRLPTWGDEQVELTDGGAMAPPRGRDEARIVECLREAGRLSCAELQQRTGLVRLAATLDRMVSLSRVRRGRKGRTDSRYVRAVELAKGSLADHLKVCGRSLPGRQVVEYLAAVGRPATVQEVEAAVGCSSGVLRRLVRLSVLNEFQQVQRLGLTRHMAQLEPSPPIVLRGDQQQAVETLEEALQVRRYRAFLLAGVTGSGKTEVYLRTAESVLRQGGSAILLVPEIALVPALARQVERRFGDNLAILHSALGEAERAQEWQRIRDGKARLVLGPRSALFAPVSNLRLIVVDEEQDSSYKQETTPRYHARDLALVRAQNENAVCVLVSATPALETRHNVAQKKITSLRLSERVGVGQQPEGILVDLRNENVTRRPGEVHFSERLSAEIEATLTAGEQVILLRNRRGYAPLLLCRACGEDMRCDECGLPRTLHRRSNCLLCHYCGSRLPIPQDCPQCGADTLEAIGSGTERVEETFSALFPGVAVDLLDRDTVRRQGNVAAVLERFARGDSQVLIGTQMVSKGHHFPKVTLTGVLAADTYLSFPDFRAVEKTYTLLAQLAGRSGRGDVPGRVVIQTFHPDHYAIQAALNADDEGFARQEMHFRRVFHYPPFTRVIQLLLRDGNRQRGAESVQALAREIERRRPTGMRVLGPAPAPMERLRSKWRFQLLLRGPSGNEMRALLKEVLPQFTSQDLTVDVDPHQLL